MRALTWIPLLVVLGACDRPGPSTDSKSNWLRECTTDRECADSLSCICGVCTMACTGAAACDRSGADAACVDAAEAALPPACVAELEGVGPRVCLAACSTGGECGAAQVCSEGSCISAAAAGVRSAAGSEAGTGGGSMTGIADSGSGASSPPSPDASSSGSVDGGLRPPLPDASNDPGGANVPMLVSSVSSAVGIYAANDDHIFGTETALVAPTRLLRWPVSGGPGERVTEKELYFGLLPRLLVDGPVLYFTAVEDPFVESSATLYRVAIDGPDPGPAALGSVGMYVVQDEQFLFYSDSDDSAVARVSKEAPDQLWSIHVSEGQRQGAIQGLALNDRTLFVIEAAAGRPGFEVIAIDKETLAPRRIERDGGLTLPPAFVFATASFLVIADEAGLERIDVATGESSRWSIRVQSMAQFGDSLYLTSAMAGEPASVFVQRFDIATGELAEPLTLSAENIKAVVPAETALYVMAKPVGVEWAILRIDYP